MGAFIYVQAFCKAFFRVNLLSLFCSPLFSLLFPLLFCALFSLAVLASATPPAQAQDTIPLDALFGVEEDAYLGAEEHDESSDTENDSAKDPLEGVNRVSYGFNRALDAMLLRPAAKAWNFLIPEPIDNAARNFVSNWKLPFSALSSLLAGDGAGAADTTERFLLNTTIGVFGFADPATSMGFPRCDEDLGQTFGVWGAGEGAYLVLPILGPSGVRDGAGTVGEFLLPDAQEETLEALKVKEDNREAIQWSTIGVDAVQTRASLLDVTDHIDATSLDPYITTRSLYRQNRKARIAETCRDYVLDFRARQATEKAE